MTTDRAPKIDARSVDDLVAQTESLLTSLTAGAWRPAGPRDSLDPLGALVRVFADMAGQLVDGVNAVPEAGFAAFLTLIGAEAQRPAPARAPLTFRLTDGAPVDATIPRGTPVGASVADDDRDPTPIVFETDAELVVTRARLLATYAHAPATDRLDPGPQLAAFSPLQPGIHELAIACPDVLARPGAEAWTLTLEFESTAPELELQWPAPALAGWSGSTLTVTLKTPPTLPETIVSNHADAWLIARLAPRPGPPPPIPKLKSVRLAATFSANKLAPKKILRGASQLDAITDFYPFESTPTLGATIAFDGGDALAQPPGTAVHFTFTRAAAVDTADTRPLATTDLRVVWELLDDTGTWFELGRSSGASSAILAGNTNPTSCIDDSLAFTVTGKLGFVLPFTAPEQRLSGKPGRWLRARIAQGGYQTLRAPIVASVALDWRHALAAVPAAMCVARDLGFERDLGPLTGTTPAAIVFTRTPPGAPALGERPALYLVFDRAFEPRPVDLWLAVQSPDPAQIAPPDQLPPQTDEPVIAWEYLSPRGWTRLGVDDGSHGLRQRGILRFVGPTDLQPAALFDRTGVWLRARWLSGSFRVPPRLSSITANTVWASHAATRRNETLGSGTGAPGQRFTLVATPVLAGERIEVREQSQPSEQQLVALREALGDDSVTAERDANGTLTDLWVRWTSVTHFRGSGPADRHYVLDAATGAVQFGDGLAGWPPPQGRSNIRAAAYATGGGPRGNRPAGAITELKAAIAYVADVTNLEPASGGTGREDPARTRARGPRRLRHRGRAVTAVDLEDLAFEAAPEVARAHALTMPFNPIDMAIDLTADGAATRDVRGWMSGTSVPTDTSDVAQRVSEVRLVLVPHGDDVDQPAPSVGLLEHVETYLRARASAAMRLHVSGPRWIRVAVRAAIAVDPATPADRLITDVRAAITKFLHPLTGGELGQGWDFGRIPRRSHLVRLIARFPGVHHVESLAVITDPPLPDASEPLTEPQRRALAGALVYSGAHELILVGPAAEDT